MAVTSPPSSMKKLGPTKSRKSNRLRPSSFTSLNVLNDKALRTAMIVIKTAVMAIAFPREILYSSIMKVMGISLNEIVEVIEAKNSRRKNNVAQIEPPGICWKMVGNISKISLGPALGSRPNEKTAGKITIPARIATSVSSPEIVTASFMRLLSSLK